jgi:hypothetical protein
MPVPIRFSDESGGLARFAKGAQAAGANVQPQTNSTHNNPLPLHVRPEIPVRSPLRKTHIFAKRLGFTAYIALPGHSRPPFDW